MGVLPYSQKQRTCSLILSEADSHPHARKNNEKKPATKPLAIDDAFSSYVFYQPGYIR